MYVSKGDQSVRACYGVGTLFAEALDSKILCCCSIFFHPHLTLFTVEISYHIDLLSSSPPECFTQEKDEVFLEEDKYSWILT